MAGESTKELVCNEDCCTACGACVNICPRACIELIKNECNEKNAFADVDKCIHCGLCKKICPNYNDSLVKSPLKVFAAWKRNIQQLEKCSSGGIATALAEYIIDSQGIVYGVTSVQKECEYIRITQSDEIERLKGSKYVYADGSKLYADIQYDILKGKVVLVIGTPCYIAGIRSYFEYKKINTSKLILIDFLCHGTVPHEYLSERLNELDKKYNFDEVRFRSNLKSENYYLTLKLNSQTVYKCKAELDYYFLSFLQSISIKECCMKCKYKCAERIGDITIGDFIGLNKEVLNENINPSLILVNTIKGEDILKRISKEICLRERSLEEAVKGGPSLRTSDMRSRERNRFRKYVKTESFKIAVYRSIGIVLMKNKIKYVIKKAIKGRK